MNTYCRCKYYQLVLLSLFMILMDSSFAGKLKSSYSSFASNDRYGENYDPMDKLCEIFDNEEGGAVYFMRTIESDAIGYDVFYRAMLLAISKQSSHEKDFLDIQKKLLVSLTTESNKSDKGSTGFCNKHRFFSDLANNRIMDSNRILNCTVYFMIALAQSKANNKERMRSEFEAALLKAYAKLLEKLKEGGVDTEALSPEKIYNHCKENQLIQQRVMYPDSVTQKMGKFVDNLAQKMQEDDPYAAENFANQLVTDLQESISGEVSVKRILGSYYTFPNILAVLFEGSHLTRVRTIKKETDFASLICLKYCEAKKIHQKDTDCWNQCLVNSFQELAFSDKYSDSGIQLELLFLTEGKLKN